MMTDNEGFPLFVEDALRQWPAENTKTIHVRGYDLKLSIQRNYDRETGRVVDAGHMPLLIGYEPGEDEAGDPTLPIARRCAWNVAVRSAWGTSPETDPEKPWSVYTFPHRDGTAWASRREPFRKFGFRTLPEAVAWRIGGADTEHQVNIQVNRLLEEYDADCLREGRRIVAEFNARREAQAKTPWGKLLIRAGTNPWHATENEIRIAKIATGEADDA